PTEFRCSQMHSAWRQAESELLAFVSPVQRLLAAAVPINLSLAEDDAATEGGEEREEAQRAECRSRDQLWRTPNVCGDSGDEVSTGPLGVALLDGQLSST
ncbi:hypothetical protein THAOC_33903, partial [Thalassiosira oceanica]